MHLQIIIIKINSCKDLEYVIEKAVREFQKPFIPFFFSKSFGDFYIV